MKRSPFLPALLAAGLAAGSAAAATAQGQQELVDRATLAAQDILGSQSDQARSLLPRARAVMICPRVMRAGFLFGGEGGGCVLVARAGEGSWSSPAFYSMGGASFGFQAGLQEAEVMLMILTQAGLRATMDSQFRVGANASVAFVTLGGGVEGATTAALNADIVAFERTSGLFAGISLQGSMISYDSAGNQAYYGQPVGPIDIVMAMRVNNPAADPLRSVLMRYGAGRRPATAYAPPPQTYASTPPPPPDYQPPAPVQQQALPPPR